MLIFNLVNEVLPADRLLPRAWELAEAIMKTPAPLTASPTPSPSGPGNDASSRISASASPMRYTAFTPTSSSASDWVP
jgi:hypothetical protein